MLEDGDDALTDGVNAVDSIDLTDQKVQEGKVVDYDVVITRERYNAGYNLTRMAVMVSGVYFGNEADREQVRGRIHRLSQNHPVVRYVYVHTGVLSAIRQDYGLVAVAASASSSRRSGHRHGPSLEHFPETEKESINILKKKVMLFFYLLAQMLRHRSE